MTARPNAQRAETPIGVPVLSKKVEDRVNILLVDDRPENLLALEAILEPLEQNLIRAMSGADALKEILQQDFAVILLDVQMPGMNGFEAAQLIKAREKSRHIPIIFLTAISKEEEYVFKGYTVGAVDYLFKPFQPDILRSKVSVFVELYQKSRQLRRQEQTMRNIERRELERQHAAELEESETRLAEVVESAMDAIIMFDTDRRIVLFNGAAERMFGRPRGEVINQPLDELIPVGARAEVLDRICTDAIPVRQATEDIGDLQPTLESFEGQRTGGGTFPVEATISCTQLGDHKIFTMIARDVTERKRADQALREQAERLEKNAAELQALNETLHLRSIDLEKAMAARSRFYASMSHELRTPINAILGYNTLMLENIYGPLNERQVHGLQRTQKAARHLLELVNDVLDLSKIEAGKIEVQMQNVLFPSLIDDLFITVRPMADERGSPLSLEHEGSPVTVTSDPRRVRQILLNLLSNAIKFGRGNPIEVRSKATEDGGVVIAVTDRGEGIPPQDLPRIFDEFVQLSQPREQEGTGLGLPISRRLALLLNGTLEVESVFGQGSTFTLKLPANADASGSRSGSSWRGEVTPAREMPGLDATGTPDDAGITTPNDASITTPPTKDASNGGEAQSRRGSDGDAKPKVEVAGAKRA